MTLHLRPAAVAIASAAFVLSTAPAALAKGDHSCSYRSVSGTFGYGTNGIRLGIGPVAGAGTVTFEEDGTMEGEQTVSFNGTIARETYSGTYSVDADCRGSFTVVVSSSIPAFNRTTTMDLVWEDDGNAAHGIFTSTGTIITADARRLFTRDD